MQAVTNAVGDHASSLEDAAEEILTIHGMHTQFRTELTQCLETAETKLEAAMAKLSSILDGVQATDAATAAALQARTSALEQSLAAKPPARYPCPDRQVRPHKQPRTHLLQQLPSWNR